MTEQELAEVGPRIGIEENLHQHQTHLTETLKVRVQLRVQRKEKEINKSTAKTERHYKKKLMTLTKDIKKS